MVTNQSLTGSLVSVDHVAHPCYRMGDHRNNPNEGTYRLRLLPAHDLLYRSRLFPAHDLSGRPRCRSFHGKGKEGSGKKREGNEWRIEPRRTRYMIKRLAEGKRFATAEGGARHRCEKQTGCAVIRLDPREKATRPSSERHSKHRGTG
jgi:hypothetical protein